MFKKQLVIIIAFAVLCAGIIGFSAFKVSESVSTFETSGYVHMSSGDSEDKKILFDSGASFKKKSGDTISFYDSLGNSSNVDNINFIHYDDASLASFAKGVLVDLDDLSMNTEMNHYAIPENVILIKNSNSYSVKDSDNTYSFTNLIWKIDESKYMFVSPLMKLHLSENDERDVNDYVEITYIGDGLIQIQTEDNIWQTISKDCKLYFQNGEIADLSNKAIKDNDENVLLDFSRIIIDSEGNVELSPYVSSNGEVVIPHFDITAENGIDGIGGDPGSNGNPGESGANGALGAPGGPGNTGEQGNAGEGVDSEIQDFPVFTIQDWTVTRDSCGGSIRITENSQSSVLQGDLAAQSLFDRVFIVDLNTGDMILPTGKVTINDGEWDFLGIVNQEQSRAFNFNGKLQPDHSYMLEVDAVTQYDEGGEPYIRPYISKTFWTDSAGFYAEATNSTLSSVSFDVIKQSNAGDTIQIECYFFDEEHYAAAVTASPLTQEGVDALAQADNRQQCIFTSGKSSMTFSGLDRNSKYYVRMVFDNDNNGSDDGISNQILELSTLKEKATIGTPLLVANSTIYGFDITPGLLNDIDNSFVSYTYQFFEVNDAGELLNPNQVPINIGPTSTIGSFSFAVSAADSYTNSIRRGTKYAVKTVGTFYDNEKYYTIESNLSNPAMLEQSIRPSVYFDSYTTRMSMEGVTHQQGVYVDVPEYDTITGDIYVSPGTNGYRLLVPDDTGSGASAPILTIKKDGYYFLQAPVYAVDIDDFNNPTSYPLSVEGKYFKAFVSSDGTVKIKLVDALDVDNTASALATAGGLQPNSLYEMTITGTLFDGVNTRTNTEVGRCMVHTGDLIQMTAMWNTDLDSEAPLQGARVMLARPNSDDTATDALWEYEFNRQQETISDVTIDLFDGLIPEDTLHQDYPTPLATLHLNKSDAAHEAKYDALFTSTGLELNAVDFFPTALDPDAVLAEHPQLTIYVKEAYDDSLDYKAYQEGYNTVSESDKEYMTDGYYYQNEFNYDNSYLTNHFTKNGQERGACYISKEVTINPISSLIWDELSYNDFNNVPSYLLQGHYPNITNTAFKVTYYVYDAVDFYNAQNIEPVGDHYVYHSPYGEDKTFQRNSEMWNYTQEGTQESIAFQFVTPVHLEGLELSKKSISIGELMPVPTVRFVPMTRDAYASVRMIPVASIPEKDDLGNTLFFLDDSGFNPNLTAQDKLTHGHQYVFAWTMEVQIPETDRKLIYPFDAQTNSNGGTTYQNYAQGYENALIKNDDVMKVSAYVTDNQNAVFGSDAYMLIPHSTTKELNGQNCIPRDEPTAHSVLWSANDSSATVRAVVYDTDNTVIKTGNTAKVYRLHNWAAGDNFDDISRTVLVRAPEDPYNYLMAPTVDTAHCTELTVSDVDGDASISTVVPIQRYNDKYIDKNSATKAYIDHSPDYNWTMKNSYTDTQLNRYFCLFEVGLNADAKNVGTSLSGALGDITAYYIWKQNLNGSIDTGDVIVRGRRSDLQKVAGFRLYFERGDKQVVLDKMIPTIDSYTSEGGADVVQFSDEEVDGIPTGYQLVRFKFAVSNELMRDRSGTRLDKNGNTVNFHYSSLEGDEPVNVKMTLLYPTVNTGYKNIARTKGTSYTSNETYGIKVFYRSYQFSNQDVDPVVLNRYVGSYYTFGRSSSIFGTDNYSDNAYTYLGSFFNLSVDNNAQLGIYSTRNWTNTLATRVQLDTNSNYSSSSNRFFTKYVPVEIGETGEIVCYTYDAGKYPFQNRDTDFDDYRKDDLFATIELPPAEPLVSYSGSENTTSSIYTNITHTSMQDKVFYSLIYSPLTDGYFDGDTATLTFIKLDNYTGRSDYPNEKNKLKVQYNVSSEGQILGATTKLFDLKSANFTNFTDTLAEFDFEENEYSQSLKNYLIPVDKTNHIDDNISFYGLNSETNYSIVAWKYVNVNGTYRFVPIDMYVSDSDNTRIYNFTTIRTSQLPSVNYVVSYNAENTNQRSVSVNSISFTNVAYDSDEYYVLAELDATDPIDNTKPGEFLTYLYLSDDISDKSFDVDGVYTELEGLHEENFLYKYDQKDLIQEALKYAPGATNLKLCDDLKFGCKYWVKLHVYKKNTGPAATATSAETYDFDLDPDSIFVNIGSGVDLTKAVPFTIGSSLDNLTRVSTGTKFQVGAPSNISFTVGSINAFSNTLKNKRLLPIAVLTHHLEGGGDEYYDVSGLMNIQDYSLSEIGKGIPENKTITFTTSKLNETTGEYEDIYQKGDTITLFLYGRQLKELDSAYGPVNANELVLGEEVDLTVLKPVQQQGLTLDSFLADRGYTPNYTNTDIYGVSITPAQMAKLKQVYTHGYLSRKVNETEKVLTSTTTSVGTVSIIHQGNNILVGFTGATAPELITRLKYSATAYTTYKLSTGEGATLVEEWLPYSYSKPLVDKTITDVTGAEMTKSTGSGAILITDIKSFTDGIDLGGGGDRPFERIEKIVYTFSFYTINEVGIELPVKINVSTAEIDNHELNADSTTLTYTQIVQTESGAS